MTWNFVDFCFLLANMEINIVFIRLLSPCLEFSPSFLIENMDDRSTIMEKQKGKGEYN